jgi:hypothetical protein
MSSAARQDPLRATTLAMASTACRRKHAFFLVVSFPTCPIGFMFRHLSVSYPAEAFAIRRKANSSYRAMLASD